MAFAACTKEQLPVADYDIIPQPKETHLSRDASGYFILQPSTKIYFEEGLQREAQFLSEYVNDIMGHALNVIEYQGQPDGIVLKVVTEDFDQAEAYEIGITPKQVTIEGADASGVFYGIQTLRKSLPISPIDSSQRTPQRRNDMGESKCQLCCGTIRDWPNFAYRGMHLDPCRHFIPLDSVKVYIDMLAMHNMNQFHFHLSDDQGWRIEIKKYPELTEIGAYRNMPPSVTSTLSQKLTCRATCRQPWLVIHNWAAQAVPTRCGSVGACRKMCFAQVTRKQCNLQRMCSTR